MYIFVLTISIILLHINVDRIELLQRLRREDEERRKREALEKQRREKLELEMRRKREAGKYIRDTQYAACVHDYWTIQQRG